jgi:hypothetical protein
VLNAGQLLPSAANRKRGGFMNKTMKTICTIVLFLLPGCAHIDFGGEGLTYYEPKSYLFVSTNKDCVTTATLISLPDTRKVMKFVPGFGSANLSATLSNGMIVTVGQQSDTKLPETISAITGLGAAAACLLAAAAAPARKVTCPSAKLYPIVLGKPDLANPVIFQIEPFDPGK